MSTRFLAGVVTGLVLLPAVLAVTDFLYAYFTEDDGDGDGNDRVPPIAPMPNDPFSATWRFDDINRQVWFDEFMVGSS